MLKTTNQIIVFFPPPLIRGCSNLTWIQPVSRSCGGGWVDETVCDRQSSPRRSVIPHAILKNTRNKNSQYWRMSKKSTSTATPKKIEPWLFAILVRSYFSFSFVFFYCKGFFTVLTCCLGTPLGPSSTCGAATRCRMVWASSWRRIKVAVEVLAVSEPWKTWVQTNHFVGIHRVYCRGMYSVCFLFTSNNM